MKSVSTRRRVAARVLAVFLSLSLIAPGGLNAATVAGAIPGQFSVSESGAATYSIPIQAPPGTGGIEPKLSLNYNSQGGNGLLGVGWSLGGFSAIGRCPKTLVQDGVKGGINFDANDRYCLDGQRLVAVTGTYGADGTEYRTERESFTKVVSYGSAGNGPAWWKVWTKSGQVMEYGNTADSRIEAQGKTTARAWALNKLTDTKGNYLTVTYAEDNPNGDFYPSRIDYTGNANTGMVPNNSVQFEYETRPDQINGYLAGSVVRNAKRLRKIIKHLDAAPVSEYRLDYALGTQTQRSRVSNVVACNVVEDNCLPATVMSWQEGGGASFPATQTSYNSQAGFSPSVYSNQRYLTGDINGDGLEDLVWVWNYQNQLGRAVWLGQPDGSFGPSQTTYAADSGYSPSLYGNQNYMLSDVNGDGRADLVWAWNYQNQLGRVVWLGTADGGFVYSSYHLQSGFGPSVYANQRYMLGDVNGDGLPDLVWTWNYQNQLGRAVWINTGSGSFGPSQTTYAADSGYSPSLYGNQNYMLSDVNGDGRADLVWAWNYQNQLGRVVWLGTADGGFVYSSYHLQSGFGPSVYANQRYMLGDVNGDGLPDLVWTWNYQNQLGRAVWINTGSGSFGPSQTTYVADSGYSPSLYGNQNYMLSDVNGDGRADLVWAWNYQNQLGRVVWLGTADGGFVYSSYHLQSGFGPSAYANQQYLIGDANGDGKGDLVWVWNYQNQLGRVIYKLPEQVPDLLSTISSGIGESAMLTYKALTDPTAYSKETGATFPLVDLQFPLYVVSSVSRSDGIGGNSITNYFYRGLKAHQQGGGLLGFRQVESTDAATGIKSITTARQDYPYQGLPTLVETKTAASTILKRVTNTWADQLLTPAAGSGGKWNKTQLTQSVEESYELNGSPVTTVTTTSTYDDWGSPTQIVVGTGDGHSKTTTNQYVNDTANWFLGRLIRSAVTSVKP